MGRLIGIALAALPFVLAWGGPLLSAAGQEGFAERIATVPFFRGVAWVALCLGGFFALLNVFLSFGRPLILQARGTPFEEQRFVSGFPMAGSLFLMFAALPFFPRLSETQILRPLIPSLDSLSKFKCDYSVLHPLEILASKYNVK